MGVHMKRFSADVAPPQRTKKIAASVFVSAMIMVALSIYLLASGFALYAFIFYIHLFMFAMGFIILFLVLAGSLFPAHSREHVWRLVSAGRPVASCIGGNRLDPELSYELRCRCEIKGMRFVTAIAIFGMLTMVGACVLHPLLEPIPTSDSSTGEPALLSFFLSFLGVGIARKWYSERRLLSRASVTLANLDPVSGAYDFRDPWGAIYGGTKEIRPENRQDNCCLVFYWPSNPSRSVPSTAMDFHRAVLEVGAASPII